MKRGQLQTEVEAVDGSSLKLNASLFNPEGAPSGTVLFCLPGGSASHEYFDLGMSGGVDYSFASHMAALGHTVISMDHPGTGTNPLSGGHRFLKPRQSSDYIAAAFAEFAGMAGCGDFKKVGVGHSMGGMVIVLTQARHRIFDGIALLGSSAGGLDWGLDDHEKSYIDRPDEVENDLEELVLRKFPNAFPGPIGGPSGKSITFGGATPEITARLREIAIPLFAAGGMTSMIKGSFIKEVEAIDVPLFFAFGDHDIGAPPEEAPAPFIETDNVELHILENCGHNSFAFPVIDILCGKLDQWALAI